MALNPSHPLFPLSSGPIYDAPANGWAPSKFFPGSVVLVFPPGGNGWVHALVLRSPKNALVHAYDLWTLDGPVHAYQNAILETEPLAAVAFEKLLEAAFPQR